MRHVVETLQVEPLDATFGAVVRDVVLRRASDATIAELTQTMQSEQGEIGRASCRERV